MKLFDLLEDPPTIYDVGYEDPRDASLFWADAYGGKEKLVELMYASINEYYGDWLWKPEIGFIREEGKPRIGFINEYYPNPNWRDECYPDSE